jgi:hypothetical protein
MTLMVFSGALQKMVHENNLKQKILQHCPFKKHLLDNLNGEGKKTRILKVQENAAFFPLDIFCRGVRLKQK